MADTERKLNADWLDSLIDRVQQQSELLEDMRVRAARAAFTKERSGADQAK